MTTPFPPRYAPLVADELELHYTVPEPPDQAIARWKADPPGPVRGMKIADEAYNSITYEHVYMDWPQKILVVATLGMALIWKGFMESRWTVTVRFDPEGAYASKVTVLGKAPLETRQAFAALAEQNGGTQGLRVGA
jgi:hypothetical protein